MQNTWRWVVGAALVIHSQVYAELRTPPGASVQLAGAQVQLGCADLRTEGTLILGAGGVLTGVRDASIASGGRLDVSNARMELAQQITVAGIVQAQAGSVVRVDAPGCPAVGQLGAINLSGPSAGAAVPVPMLDAMPMAVLAALLALLGWRRIRPSVQRP